MMRMTSDCAEWSEYASSPEWKSARIEDPEADTACNIMTPKTRLAPHSSRAASKVWCGVR